MSVDDFFKKYPGALEVLKVGEKLFFASFESAANNYAQRSGHPVQRIVRPKSAKPKSDAKPEAVASQPVVTDATE